MVLQWIVARSSLQATPSLGPRLELSSKPRRTEPVTFVRKAVDFWCVIIHVINEGHSYFYGKCRASYKSVTRYSKKLLFVFKASSASSRSETLLQANQGSSPHQSCKQQQTISELVLQWTARSDQWPSCTPVNCLLPTFERYSVLECSVLSLQFVR